MPLLPNINFGYPFRARRPKRLPDPPQQEEVCIECVKRDQDMADVDVIRPGVWERESDVLYEELKQREQEEEASGNTNVDRSHPKARGASLSEQNLALWLSMAQNPREPTSKRQFLHAYIKSQRILLEAEALAKEMDSKLRDTYQLHRVTLLENGMIVEHVDEHREEERRTSPSPDVIDIHDNSTSQLESDEKSVSPGSLDSDFDERRYHYEPLNLNFSSESLMSSFPPHLFKNSYIQLPGSGGEKGGMQSRCTSAENNGSHTEDEDTEELSAKPQEKDASNPIGEGLPCNNGLEDIPHNEIDEFVSGGEDEEANGTSEPKQNRVRSSSSPPPSESLSETPQSLFVALTELRAVRSPLVNDNTLLLFRKLLDIPDATVALGMKNNNSDVEALLDFLLHILREGSLSNCIVQDANRKARRLMFKLVSKTDVMPRSLFITDIEKDPQAIAVGGFGKVFMGKCGEQLVAMKMLFRGHHAGDSIEKNICKEALAWRSLSHRFILPLLGIYEEGPQLFLVSPFMTNGALRDWRRQLTPVRIDEIERLLLEVAKGFQYIHSEGIVHGDLHSGNVLLDSEFHCQITDFGSTRHSEATDTGSTTALAYNYAAPELFGMCATCCQFDCDESHDGQDEQHNIKTMKTDVYAFGCLYYAIFFDTVPFHGKNNFQITRLVTKGVRPNRLKIPTMEDFRWDLIQRCWKSNPSERPTMEGIATALIPLA